MGIIHRKGLRKTRHIDTGLLWAQQVAAEKRLKFGKVLGRDNPVDLFTKHLDWETINRQCTKLAAGFDEGRAESAPKLHSFLAVREIDTGNEQEVSVVLANVVGGAGGDKPDAYVEDDLGPLQPVKSPSSSSGPLCCVSIKNNKFIASTIAVHSGGPRISSMFSHGGPNGMDVGNAQEDDVNMLMDRYFTGLPYLNGDSTAPADFSRYEGGRDCPGNVNCQERARHQGKKPHMVAVKPLSAPCDSPSAVAQSNGRYCHNSVSTVSAMRTPPHHPRGQHPDNAVAAIKGYPSASGDYLGMERLG